MDEPDPELDEPEPELDPLRSSLLGASSVRTGGVGVGPAPLTEPDGSRREEGLVGAAGPGPPPAPGAGAPGGVVATGTSTTTVCSGGVAAAAAAGSKEPAAAPSPARSNSPKVAPMARADDSPTAVTVPASASARLRSMLSMISHPRRLSNPRCGEEGKDSVKPRTMRVLLVEDD